MKATIKIKVKFDMGRDKAKDVLANLAKNVDRHVEKGLLDVHGEASVVTWKSSVYEKPKKPKVKAVA